MTDPEIDWAEIGRVHALKAREIERSMPTIEEVSRALHVERCAAEAHAAEVAKRANAAGAALNAARRDLDVSRSIMQAQAGRTTAWALEYLRGHRTDDDAFQAAKARGWAHPDGTRTRGGFDVLFAINATINATETTP